ncbi:hypothetical protein [Oxalobacter paraformigenes]|uniref:Uncharacterized protein n=1 Tax=Oxalobacter paraformigenes TaxID=556268 RepID=C3X3B0_9BURK|nr:hypothetical protein [Oxalobacter paraformigenes]EEO27696.2 hypothetical protein OFAG_00849 [Oxalobacter paraformigenes]
MSRQNKRRNKTYRPRDPGCVKLKTLPWVIDSVFSPLYSIIDQLEEDGTIYVANDDVPLFLNRKDGRFYETVSAVTGFIEGYEIHERRTGRNLHMDPLRHLVALIKNGEMITPSDTRHAREALDRIRTETMGMTWNYADEMLRDFRIKEELSGIHRYVTAEGEIQ